jgi:vacuolar-type H+-ATPase subunit H
MKKVFMMALAAAALTFSSCGNKTNVPNESEIVDSTEVALEEANTAADEVIAQLTEKIEAKDVSALQAALETVKAKVSEFLANNPEIAKEYLAKVQNFLKENADKIKSVIGDNAAVSSLVDGIAAIPSESVDALTGAGDALKALGIDLTEKAGDAVEGAKDAAADAVEGAKDKAEEISDEVKENVKEKVGDAIDKGAADAKKKLGL